MQHLRQYCAATALVFALTISTFGGDMHFPYAPTPTPTPGPVVTDPGDEEGGSVSSTSADGTAASPLTVTADIMLSLLQSVSVLI